MHDRASWAGRRLFGSAHKPAGAALTANAEDVCIEAAQAKEKCDDLKGDAKASCLTAAKAQFGKS